MKKGAMVLTAMMALFMFFGSASAGGWEVPSGNSTVYSSDTGYYTTQAELIEDLATRSGPSTQYTGCGSYRMKGQYVTVISRAFDNGGVQWAQVEINYGGAVRRMYTGVKRLSISNRTLAAIREEDMSVFLGYGTINCNVNPKWGPGSYYATYTDRTLCKGTQVAVITAENGYYQIECYHTNREVLRCWVPMCDICMN